MDTVDEKEKEDDKKVAVQGKESLTKTQITEMLSGGSESISSLVDLIYNMQSQLVQSSDKTSKERIASQSRTKTYLMVPELAEFEIDTSPKL